MKKALVFALILVSFFLTSLFNPEQAFAQITNPFLGNSLQNISGSAFFARLLPALITLLLVIGTIIFVFMLIAGAIQWVTSGGEKGAYEAARNKVTNAIIGLIILFSLFAIVELVETFFGVSITTLNFNDFAI
jgi:uncharacterized protein YggT (Ycf19 family)